MALSSLKDVYIDQLQDIYSANRQALDATRKLQDVAKSSELKEALGSGVKGIEQGIEVVGNIVKSHDAKPTAEFCKGMEGLVKEVKAHVLDADFGDDDVRDAMIITQYQRMAHYGMAGYGCVVAFAERLGLDSDADKLRECKEETEGGDAHMTGIALGSVNKAAQH
ncbi:ferritin-like domain-containing protein [Henriciella aquimarina]|uniref:ferritin-like domain-containing protein n=1 Tax=Henriciella aquimarina TaxID=545261 RepID=UPI0009FD362D|nr:ferritin-like domain-containing protein [Henriciella aquimarina]